MAHSHSHDVPLDPGPPRQALGISLAILVAAITVGALAAMIQLWPSDSDIPRDKNPYAGAGVSRVNATVTDVEPFDCGSGGLGPDQVPTVDGDCAQVLAQTDDGTAEFTLDSARYQAGIDPGDQIRLIRIAPDGQPATYEFLDFQRGIPIIALAIAFGVLVIAVARWRGLFAIAGIGITLVALTQFILPALLTGKDAMLTTVVGSTIIMIAVLYLAHGVSIRTTAALFGTLFGIAATAALGLGATRWTHLTGIGSEDDRTLVAIVPTLDLSSIVAASMVVAGLGVLNDVTITQASAVWELRALQPDANRRSLFSSAMRIGRDHIASSVYTLIFAYAGSAMVVLLLVTAYQQSLTQFATTDQIGQEVVRTLVGAIGLVLAVPVTTAIAVALAAPVSDDPVSDDPASDDPVSDDNGEIFAGDVENDSTRSWTQ